MDRPVPITQNYDDKKIYGSFICKEKDVVKGLINGDLEIAPAYTVTTAGEYIITSLSVIPKTTDNASYTKEGEE